MPALEAEGRPYADVEHVGIAIQTVELNRWHTGLLYRLPNEPPRILHLEFHNRLADDEAAIPYRWAQIGLDSENKLVLAELIARIARRNPKIPYSFDCTGVRFDAESGDLAPPPAGKGLTCASLIVAVLATYGHELLDLETWPVRAEDDEFVQWIADVMEAHEADADHVAAVRSNLAARLRPPEVAGSAIKPSDEWPVHFEAANDIASEVIADLA